MFVKTFSYTLLIMKRNYFFVFILFFIFSFFLIMKPVLALDSEDSAVDPEVIFEVQSDSVDDGDLVSNDGYKVVSEDEIDLVETKEGFDGWGVETISGLNIIQLLNDQKNIENNLEKVFSEKELQLNSWYKHFLFGPNFAKAKEAKNLIEQNSKNIELLGQFSVKMPRGSQRQKLGNVISEKTKANDYFKVKLEEFLNQKSILGWLFRIFYGV